MDNVDLQVLKSAGDWLRTGSRVVLGTVVGTWGSAPRPVGALVAVRDDGLIAGSVSGGCIEDDLVERIRSKSLAARAPQRVRYGVTADEAFRFGLPCGGGPMHRDQAGSTRELHWPALLLAIRRRIH